MFGAFDWRRTRMILRHQVKSGVDVNKQTLMIAATLAGVFSVPAMAQSNAELRLVKALFAQIQPLSFDRNREFCGYIGYNGDGALVASKPKRGRINSCKARWPDELDVIASYHTHGAFSPQAPAEFPSSDDLLADEEEGVDGWVGTPGGRLWYVDSEALEVSQVCGIGCLPQDPNFEAGLDGEIAQSYTLDALTELEE